MSVIWNTKMSDCSSSLKICVLTERDLHLWMLLNLKFVPAFWWWRRLILKHCSEAFPSDPLCCWPRSRVFLRIPSGSCVWLVLMDTTCAFHVFCAWNKVGRAQGSVWAHPFTLPWAVVLVMNVQGKHEHAKYLGLIQTQSWLHSLEI